jgi:hypothetical protein
LPDRVDVPKAMLGEEDPPHALERFDLVTTYPSKPQSRRLTVRRLPRGWRNPSFLIIPAILNLLLFAANTCRAAAGRGGDRRRSLPTGATATCSPAISAVRSQVVLALTLWLLLASFYKVKKTTRRWVALIERGCRRCTARGGASAGVRARRLVSDRDRRRARAEGAWFTIVAGALVLVFGAVLGSLVFGTYLVIALAVFKRHANENFSASRYETYKNFPPPSHRTRRCDRLPDRHRQAVHRLERVAEPAIAGGLVPGSGVGHDPDTADRAAFRV